MLELKSARTHTARLGNKLPLADRSSPKDHCFNPQQRGPGRPEVGAARLCGNTQRLTSLGTLDLHLTPVCPGLPRGHSCPHTMESCFYWRPGTFRSPFMQHHPRVNLCITQRVPMKSPPVFGILIWTSAAAAHMGVQIQLPPSFQAGGEVATLC